MQRSKDPRYAKMVSDHHQVIPRALLWSMAALALTSLGLVTFATLTDRPHEAQIHIQPEVKSLLIQINAREDGGTTVLGQDGEILKDTPSNVDGFITVVRTALEFERKRNAVEGNPPVHLIRFADGRVGIRDDATGWKINLVGFGQDNARVWNALIAD